MIRVSIRAITPILIFCLAGVNCKSKSEKSPVVKSIQNPKFIQGAWHLYDTERNSLIGKGPLFELAGQQRFIDSAEILCHFSKLKNGDLLDLIRRHSDSNPKHEKLQNCPDYSYEGDILGVQIFNASERDETPIVTINFADMKKMARLADGRLGQVYYLYVEVKNSAPMLGTMMFSPNKTQINRVPVVLIRSP